MGTGFSMEKIMIVLLIAAIFIGPQQLPVYTAKLAEWTRHGRRLFRNARERLRDEIGPDYDDIDWKKLDPRRYDPRAIIRETLLEPDPQPSRPSTTDSSPKTEPLSGPRREQAEGTEISAGTAEPVVPD